MHAKGRIGEESGRRSSGFGPPGSDTGAGRDTEGRAKTLKACLPSLSYGPVCWATRHSESSLEPSRRRSSVDSS